MPHSCIQEPFRRRNVGHIGIGKKGVQLVVLFVIANLVFARRLLVLPSPTNVF